VRIPINEEKGYDIDKMIVNLLEGMPGRVGKKDFQKREND
jgi:hypothetical protein